ncbi:MAG: tRNA dihydrouridine synthase DusB [Clostridia bacterium]|nr:tRNA dihydrouridine synthase DusB [Clostridia bacterium]
MRIGHIEMPEGAALAPMAGISDAVMRRLCHEMGCAWSVSEMLSAKGYVYAPDRRVHREITTCSQGSGICGLQLFGREEDMLVRAIEMLNSSPFDFFDFNMGCPAPKVVQNGEGSALMKEPLTAYKLIKSMVKAAVKPVTVKIRAGWDRDSINAVEIAKVCEDAGASALCVHPRTRDMYYSGLADRGIIADVKQAVGIPVIGNGDIKSADDALSMIAQTHCDAVMVARAAQGNIWIFKEILCALRGESYTPPTNIEKIETLKRHALMQIEALGEYMGVMEMRKHVAWYLRGMPGSATLRASVNELANLEQVFQALDDYAQTLI